MELLNIKTKEKCGIYIITNIINGNRYIGSSDNLYKRIYIHRYKLRSHTHQNIHLQNAFDKYGEENFQVGILAYCSPQNKLEIEKSFIDFFNPEYNIDGIEDTTVYSRREKTKLKISESVKKSYESGKLKERLDNCKNRQIVYIYNLENWTLEKTCTRKEAGNFFGLSDLNEICINSRIFHNKYVVLDILFKNVFELKNFVCENMFKYPSYDLSIKYLIAEYNNELIYFKTIPDLVKKFGSSRSTLIQHLKTATKKNPYIIKKSNVSVYFSNTFIKFCPVKK